jgi:toxin ParE1/3/4
MAYNLVLSFAAENDLEKIIKWYGKENTDLIKKFVKEFEEKLQIIILNPFLFQEFYKDYRKANTGKFPYKMVYRISNESIVIIAIVHNKRHSKVWKKRI